MHAHVLRQPAPLARGPLSFEERPDPSPGPGQVRVRVHACAACRTDLHVVTGELAPRHTPLVPGHQVVGQIDQLGEGVAGLALGQRVAVAWLHATCGGCRFCRRGAENLCQTATFTGYSCDGGFAELMLARADFTYPLPDDLGDEQAAPLLCAGITGYRCLARTGLEQFAGARLGVYGFGAAGQIAMQIARARGAEVYVCTGEPAHHEIALSLGARWSGGMFEAPPLPLDAAIVFAPAGEIVPAALTRLDKGGRLVLARTHMSEIPAFPHADIYGERSVCSVVNNTPADGRAFLAEAGRIGLRTQAEVFPFDALPEALAALERGMRGAAVLRNAR